MRSRRGFLRALGLVAAGSAGLLLYRREAERTLLFDALRGERDVRAPRLGEAWLEQTPAERDIAVLRARLGLDGKPGLFGRHWRAALASRFRADLAADDTVLLHGWLVTRTEARIAALLVLARKP